MVPLELFVFRIDFPIGASMPNIKKILLPVDFPNPSLGVIHQAAAMARHFPLRDRDAAHCYTQDHAAGVPEDGAGLAGWDLLEEVVRSAQEKEDQTLARTLIALTDSAHPGEGQHGPSNSANCLPGKS